MIADKIQKFLFPCEKNLREIRNERMKAVLANDAAHKCLLDACAKHEKQVKK